MVGYKYDIDGVVIPKDWTIRGFITNQGILLSVNSKSDTFSFDNKTKEEVIEMIKNYEKENWYDNRRNDWNGWQQS